LNPGTDVDLFRYNWGGGVLTLNTFSPPNLVDPQLHLFDGTGVGIGENDDAAGLQSEISLNLAAGAYLIGISSFNNDALDAVNGSVFGFTNTFDDLNGNFIQGPEPGAGLLAGWDNETSASPGSYVISFSSPTVTVPEPSLTALLSLGLVVTAFARRRPSSKATDAKSL
jgi:hypothetical protein